MKKIKYVFPAFSFYDRTGIQQFLEKKAEQGWMLEKMGGLTWKFRCIAPKKIHFAVTYFPKASAFDPKPSEEQEVFQEFCAHSGWRLVSASAQMQIFCNEEENPVPIETDPEIELENIHATAKKTYLPTYFMLLPVGIFPWLSIGMAWESNPITFLGNNIYFYNVLTSVVTLLLCLTELIGYYRWRSKALTAAKEGEFLPTKGNRKLQIVLICFMLFSLAVLILDGTNPRIGIMMASMLLLIGAGVALSLGAVKLMKKMNFSAQKNMAITYAIIIVLSLAAVGLGTFGVMELMDEWNREEKTLPTYEYHGEIWTLYRDEVPLRIQDMVEVEPELYSYRISLSGESLLLKYTEAYQRPRYDRLDQPDLRYTIVEVKVDFLYDFCLNTMLESKQDAWSEDIYGNITYDAYRQMDATPWTADAAYQKFNGENALGEYLLCYGDRIIQLDPDWDMTGEQMARIGAIFG